MRNVKKTLKNNDAVVQTSEEDPAPAVVRFTSELAWADAGHEVAEPQVTRLCAEAQECGIMGGWFDLVSLLLTSAEVILSKVSENDLECIFTVICNLVTKSESPDEALEMAKLISSKITQKPSDKPALRLKILFNLYNLLENPYSRFLVYLSALNLAINGKVAEHELVSFQHSDQRQLFLAIANVLKEHKNLAKESFKFLTKYLATFSGEDAHTLSEAKEEACDLLNMPAVEQLEKDAKHALAYQLLKIFLTQRLDAYLEFQAANSDLLKSYDIECIFTVICNVVTKSESPDEALEMAKLISSKITQKPTDKPALRLNILFNLYNLLENPYCRFLVYLSALNLAINGKVAEHVIPTFKKVESFLKEWNIGISDQRQLFLAIANVLKEHKNLAKESFKFLTKYLATFSGEDAHTLSEAKEEAVRTIVEFVKAPDMFQCDLLNMPAVEQLEKDAKHALAYQLLKIFLTQRLDAYLEFQAANFDLLKSYGLGHEDCITKMRLISLMDLGSDESGRILTVLSEILFRLMMMKLNFGW
ncbi:unnamed protein product [Malus baccata var. baccata]